MNWSYLITLTVVSRFHGVFAEDDNCFMLFNKCNARHNCLAALLNLRLLCHELLFGENGSGCTQSCKEAIKLVDTDRYGKYFLSCNCDRDSECLTHQARASACLHNRTIGNKIGCSTYSRQCKDDRTCNNIMENFYLKCTHLISGTECTPACEMVQEELYSHNITKGLLDCECSGTVREENFCRGITAHTLHLCKTSPMVRRFNEGQSNGKGRTLETRRNSTKSRLQIVVTASSNSLKLRCEYIPNIILVFIALRQLYDIANSLSMK